MNTDIKPWFWFKKNVKDQLFVYFFLILIYATLRVCYDLLSFSCSTNNNNNNDAYYESPVKQLHYSSKNNYNGANNNNVYLSSLEEQYLVDHSKSLGFEETERTKLPHTCNLYTKTEPVKASLEAYIKDLEHYEKLVKNFSPIPDIRLSLDDNNDNHNNVCQKLELHPQGISGLFNSSLASTRSTSRNTTKRQISYASSFGWIEPLLPPMRHPAMCLKEGNPMKKKAMDLSYLIHDFAAFCRLRLKRHSKIIMVDAGASLEFHDDVAIEEQPAIYLSELYRKFGFPFDHIYAFEYTPLDPQNVFPKVPDNQFASYHWINVAVESDENSRMNPLKFLSDHYTEDDFIVFKLDIDTPSVELPIVHQLLADATRSKLIDVFYFEHHVALKEFYRKWTDGTSTVQGSLGDSMRLFAGLRQQGVAAHSWV